MALFRPAEVLMIFYAGDGRWSLSLLRGGITQAPSGRAHVPEIPPPMSPRERIEVQHRRKRRGAVRLRLPVAETRSTNPGKRRSFGSTARLGP